MRNILILVGKDFSNLRRNRAALSLMFVVPFALIYFMGQIWGINRKDPGPTGIPLAVINQSDQPAAQKLVDSLKQEKSFRLYTTMAGPDKSRQPLSEARAREMIQSTNSDYRFALVIPRDLIRSERLGLHLQILSNPRNEIETQEVYGLLEKTIFSNVPELIGQSLQERAKAYIGSAEMTTFNRSIAQTVARTFGGDAEQIFSRMQNGNFGLSNLTNRAPAAPADPSLRRLDSDPKPDTPAAATPAATNQVTDIFSRLVKVDVEKVVGANVKNPAATMIVGGWAMQFLLFALSGGAAGLFRDRDSGIFQRLLAAPVSRGEILGAKFLYGILIGLVQLLVLFCAGKMLYGIEVEKHFFTLTILCVFAAAACTSFGMLLAAIAPNADAASGLATFLILMLSAIGGAWFPISLMPAFVQQLSKFSLVYWALEGFSAVLWAGKGLFQIGSILGVLGAMTAVVMAVAVWRFNRGRLFD